MELSKNRAIPLITFKSDGYKESAKKRADSSGEISYRLANYTNR